MTCYSIIQIKVKSDVVILTAIVQFCMLGQLVSLNPDKNLMTYSQCARCQKIGGSRFRNTENISCLCLGDFQQATVPSYSQSVFFDVSLITFIDHQNVSGVAEGELHLCARPGWRDFHSCSCSCINQIRKLDEALWWIVCELIGPISTNERLFLFTWKSTITIKFLRSF